LDKVIQITHPLLLILDLHFIAKETMAELYNISSNH